MRLLPSLLPFAGLFHFAINVLRWGEHRGGMFVSVAGLDAAGKPIERSWHLLAEGDHGPLIPSMAVEALVRKSLAGQPPAVGARAATHELELEDYEEIFRKRTIFSGQRESALEQSAAPLYRRMLGDAWSSLPAPVQRMHDWQARKQVAGLAKVERGRGLLVGLVARLFGFPTAGENIPVSVSFSADDCGEYWRRTFGGKSFSSQQTAGHGQRDRLLVERFGPFSFGLALVVDGEGADCKLRLVVRDWRFLGIPLPSAWAPGGSSYEQVSGGRFCFHVEISLPVIGLIVRYQGWLEEPHQAEA